jgi:molybdopterin molybdotransferase
MRLDRRTEMLHVVTVDQAVSLIRKGFMPHGTHKRVPLLDAVGRIAAENVQCPEDLPRCARSTVDGYAVRSADTFGATRSLPAYLEFAGEIPIGTVPERELSPEQSARIPTGGVVPKGADAVVMVEDTEDMVDGTIGVLRAVSPGDNIIKPGDDVRIGEVLVTRGSRIRPYDLGLCAAVGITDLKVTQRLRLGIIPTGNEIIPAETRNPEPGKIRDLNTYTLGGLAREAGMEIEVFPIAPDDPRKIQDAVRDAVSRNDIVVLSGGSSVGERDYTERVLSELPGFKMLFHGVSIKPGKPSLAATSGDRLVCGLPGHPGSAVVVFDAIVLSAVVAGWDNRRTLRAVLSRNLASSPGREEYVHVTLKETTDGLVAVPVLGKSGLIFPMVRSDGYLVIPLSRNGLSEGTTVDIILHRGFHDTHAWYT